MRHAACPSTGGHVRARLRSHDRLFSAIRPAPPATPHAPARPVKPARHACPASPTARARPPRPPATRHRAPGIHPGGSRAARPAGGRSRNVADGAPDRPAGADGSGPRGRGVACRTGDDESGFRPGAATATWRRRVASGARLREAALLADAHPWRIEVLRPARDFRLHARPGLRIARLRACQPSTTTTRICNTRAARRARQRTSSRPIRCPCG